MSVDLFHDPVIRVGSGANKKRRMRLWWKFADGSETGRDSAAETDRGLTWL